MEDALELVNCKNDRSKLQNRHNQSESKSQEPEADPSPNPQQKTSELLEPSQHLGRKLSSVPRIPA